MSGILTKVEINKRYLLYFKIKAVEQDVKAVKPYH